jgi:5'-deoxynucleotidase
MSPRSHFFAWLSRMKFIRRWGLMYSTYPESISEHSHRVATIAHALALIGNRAFGGSIDADRAAVVALFHDASEVLTGDLPAPVKYFNPAIRDAYRAIEHAALGKLRSMLPESLRDGYAPYLACDDAAINALVKAADTLCAYLKCIEETSAGNREFAAAERTLRAAVEGLHRPDVDYFLAHFVDSFRLPLDELD